MPRGRDLDEVRAALPEQWRHLPVFSYSQLTSADKCGMFWYIRYHLKQKVTARNTDKRDLGTFAHAFMADLYRSIADHGMTAEQWLDTRFQASLMEVLDQMDLPDQITAVNAASKVVRRYCRTDVLAGHTPVGIEQHFMSHVTTPTGREFILQGYVDLFTVDPRGRIWAWDHETSENLWPPKSIKSFLQLPVYQVLMQAEGYDVHGVMVNRLNSHIYKNMDAEPDTKLFRRESRIWTPGQLNNIWKEFLALADHTLDLMSGRAQVRRSITPNCFRCDYVGGCFAALEGHDLIESLQIASNQHQSYRGVPVGESLILNLEG